MDQTLEKLLLEMTGDSPDENLKGYIRRRFEDAKKIKDKRKSQLKAISDFLHRLTDNVNTSYGMEYLERESKDRLYISPIATTIIEKKSSSDFFPEFNFDPEERMGAGSDIYLARNATRIFNFGLKVGKFRRACQDGAQDLFEKGRMVLQMGFKTSGEGYNGKAQFIKFRHKKWDSVFVTEDEKTVFIIEDSTYGEVLDTFGEAIKNFKIREGSLYATDGNEIDQNDRESFSKTVQVAHVYDSAEGFYACQIGGEDNFFKLYRGKSNPYRDDYGNPFMPIVFIDASSVKRNGHPISDIDKILPICMNYDHIFQGIVRKAKRSANSRDYIASTNPKKQRMEWLQSEADLNSGLDLPVFMSIQEGQSVFSKTLDTVTDYNSPLALRNAFIDEIMMTTGVNLRLLGGGADTARQEELRIRRELEVIDEMIKINEPNWEDLALNYMQMLRNVDAEFYDEYVAIEDEISERHGVPDEGKIGDIIKNIKGFPFNVRVSVNQSNSKRKTLEVSQKESALGAIAPFAQGSMAVARMAYSIAEDKFPGMKFTEEDFLPKPIENPAPMQAPEVPGLKPLTNPV